MQTFQQLQIVAALAQHRHFGRAAQALGISQPALTKAVRAIERNLGVSLFDRGPPVAPTLFGSLVLRHGQAILTEAQMLKREIALARGLDTGRLAISAGGQVAEFAAIDAVAAISRNHPFIVVNLQIGNHLSVTQDVLEGRADVGVAQLSAADGHPDLTVERLRRTSYVLFCAPDHPLSVSDEIPPGVLLDYPWIGASASMPVPPEETDVRRAYGELDRSARSLELRLSSNSFSAIIAIVMKSRAVSAAPAQLIAHHVAAGRLHQLRAPYGWPELDYGVILKKNRTPSPATLAYLAELRRLEAALDV